MRIVLFAKFTLAMTVPIVFCSARSWANTDAVAEGVDDYTFYCGNSGCNTTCYSNETTGFYNTITASGTPWTQGNFFFNNSVFDTDFYDPDITGNSVDNDTDNFDPSGSAFSFVCAHGSCTGSLGDASSSGCTVDADCPGLGNGGYCPKLNYATGETGLCINQTARVLITSSSFSSHNNLVVYGTSYGGSANLSFALGEDTNSGTFDNAAENGGVNIAMITNSCGMRGPYIYNYNSRFIAGVHELFMNMPAANVLLANGTQNYSDTLDWASRGSYVANAAVTNPNGAASDAWLAVAENVDNSYTASVNGSTHNEGANIVMASDVSCDAADARVTGETWSGTLNESNDTTSNACEVAYWACNYDCATLGF